jgi:hypothetical protein
MLSRQREQSERRRVGASPSMLRIDMESASAGVFICVSLPWPVHIDASGADGDPHGRGVIATETRE